MALVIPCDFARRIAAQAEAPLQVILSGSDSNTATIALGYADAIAADLRAGAGRWSA